MKVRVRGGESEGERGESEGERGEGERVRVRVGGGWE